MHRPEPTFLGYLARDVWTVAANPAAPGGHTPVGPGTDEVCSVAVCVSPAYQDREAWAFNATSFCYDTPELALAAVPASRAGAEERPWPVRVFGYAMYPLGFDQHGEFEEPVASMLDLRSPLASQRRPGVRSLGFDAVGIGACSSFGCSPLSCNGCWAQHPVNRHCLLATWDGAVAAALDFGKSEPEPGPYCIVEVLEV